MPDDAAAPLILVVDDEENLARLVRAYLEREGYRVAVAATGPAGLEVARAQHPDLVVLDLMLPGMDGLEVCRRLHAESDVYVLMLTAKSEEVDKIVGLSVGADDYMTKPFSPRELVARVKAILRRRRATAAPATTSPSATASVPGEEVIVRGGLVIHPANREVRRAGQLIELTQLEFDLLRALAEAPGRVFSRSQLLDHVWGYDYVGEDRVVDVHIAQMRKKVEPDPANPTYIKTVRGVGYKFDAGEE